MTNTKLIVVFHLENGSAITKQRIVPTASLKGEEFSELLEVYSDFSKATNYEVYNEFTVTEAPTGRGVGRSFTYVDSRTFINPAKVMHIMVKTLEIEE
jgi:hypothetical protein